MRPQAEIEFLLRGQFLHNLDSKFYPYSQQPPFFGYLFYAATYQYQNEEKKKDTEIYKNQAIRDEANKELQRDKYYIEFLKVTMSLGLPKDLNCILLDYCKENISKDVRKLLPENFYPQIITKAIVQFNKKNTGIKLSKRLSNVQREISNQQIQVQDGTTANSQVVLLISRNSPQKRIERQNKAQISKSCKCTIL